jgi:hypothetical protein
VSAARELAPEAADPPVRPLLVVAVATAAAALALHVTISTIYATLIVDVFGGELGRAGSGPLDDLIAYLVTVIAAALVGAYCRRRPGAGALMLAFQLTFVVIPLQALVTAGYVYASPLFGTTVGLSLVAAALTSLYLPALRVGLGRGVAVGAVIVLVALTLYTFGSLVAAGGLGRLNFDLSKVYDFRADFLEQNAFPASGYLVPWSGYVLTPALLVLGMRLRSVLVVGAGLVLEVVLFGMTNFRAFLFVPVLLLGGAWLGRRLWLPVFLIGGAVSVAAIGMGVFAVTGDTLLPGIAIDRLLVIPAELHYWYYDYFHTQGHPLLLLTQSVLSHYGRAGVEPIAETVGWAYMGSNASANVGLFGDAYANFGLAGCVVFGVLFGILVRLVESLAAGLSRSQASALVGAPALALVNSGFLTTLATHGLLLMLVVMWLLRAVPDRARRGAEG